MSRNSGELGIYSIPVPSPQSKRLYGYRWQQESRAYLAAHPLCQCPQCDEGRVRVRVATVVDHKVRHKGDPAIFWDQANWQSMAKQCHDSYKSRLERSGTVAGVDQDGLPLDPNHPWRRPGRG